MKSLVFPRIFLHCVALGFIVSGLLLSERPWVRIPPGTPANTPKTFDLSGFSAFLISAAFVAFFAKNLGLLTFANEIWPFAKKGGKSEVRFLPKELANIC